MRVVGVGATALVMVLAASCSSSARIELQTSQPRKPSPTTAPSGARQTVAGSGVRTCQGAELQLNAEWEAAAANPGLTAVHHPAGEMEGTLSITNTSSIACSAPTKVAVSIEGPTGSLNVPSQGG